MNPETFLSPIKRQRGKKQKAEELKQYMRSSLPVHTRSSIRKFREPYYTAVLEELGEQGYTHSKEFLWQLIEYQENIRAEQGPDGPANLKPRLLVSSVKIDVLQEALKFSEQAHFDGNTGKEIDIFISLLVEFGFRSDDWWWLAEQLFIQAINICADYWRDNGRRKAVVKYLYGKFLLEKVNIPESAKIYLNEAKQISIGQDWRAKELGIEEEFVFIACCRLLFTILMSEAKHVLVEDPLAATKICDIAEKLAVDVCNRKGQADALLLKGLCQMELGDACLALQLFQIALRMYTRDKIKGGICESRIYIAFAFLNLQVCVMGTTSKSSIFNQIKNDLVKKKFLDSSKTMYIYPRLENYEETRVSLEILLDYAQENDLPFYVAQAYRSLGEFYLNQGDAYIATPMLLKSVHIFNEIGDEHNREQARNLAAISSGQELFPKYADLILKCGYHGSSVLKLIDWKDTRELFWSERNESNVTLEVDLQHADHLEESVAEETVSVENESESQISSLTSFEKDVEVVVGDLPLIS